MAKRGLYEFSTETKELARKRARYCCERCGRRGTTEIHHRIPVYMARELNLPHLLITSLANAEVLCPNCHAEADQETHDWIPFAQSILGVVQLQLV